MKSLLILLVIYVVGAIAQKVKNSKLEKEQQARRQAPPPEQSGPTGKNRNLQDLIRQFENAQQQAAQGSVEPPVSPLGREELEDYCQEDSENDLPTVDFADPSRITFREIAESVIQWEEVSTEYLMEAFGFSEKTARQVLADLQAHHIVGRDMGEGFCDLLVHDKTELDNLFKREQREAEERKAAQAQDAALKARREAEAAHQQELAQLEERARKAREQAGQINDGMSELGSPCLASGDHRTHSRSFDKAEIRRGFVWAKVLDEPRFKKKWNARVR
ncbi:MAG: hypothetical protein MJY87_03935 [Fibrobacter sp.]|nr:hypothetical protein [Fibrobacter sp.]